MNSMLSRNSKCLLAYIYGLENAGDFAICLGSIDYLLNYYTKVVAVSRFSANDPRHQEILDYLLRRYGDKVILLPGPFSLDRSNRFKTLESYAKGVVSFAKCMVFGWQKETVKECACVYINGGNILRCATLTDYIRLKPFLFFSKLARRNRIPCVFLPQSTTEIKKYGAKAIVRELNQAALVCLRESQSFKLIKKVMAGNPLLSIDMAYFIHDYTQIPSKYNVDKNTICITLRNNSIGDLGKLDTMTQREIQKDVLRLMSALKKENAKPLIVVQTSKDLEFSKAVASMCDYEVAILEEHDPLILRVIYANCRCLIGMRLHSLILASSVGTPIVGYFDRSWGLKNPGTLGDLKMPYAYIGDDVSLYSLMNDAQLALDEMCSIIEHRKNELAKFSKDLLA